MTYRTFKKMYEGKFIEIEMGYQKHSIANYYKIGRVTPIEGHHNYIKDNNIISIKHYDFIIMPKHGKWFLLTWDKIELIRSIKVIDEKDVDEFEKNWHNSLRGIMCDLYLP